MKLTTRKVVPALVFPLVLLVSLVVPAAARAAHFDVLHIQRIIDVAMTVGDETARFTIEADLRLGIHDLAITRVARTASAAIPTDVPVASWGRLKAAYR